jgi:Uma2 family endonuclease
MSATTHVSPRNTLAPWAEIVPNAPPMTVDDLESLPDDEGWVYELVEGVLVRMPMSGYEASHISTRLLVRVGAYVEDHNLGGMTGEQGGYRVDPANPRTTELAPNIAFVRADRLPPRDSPEYRKALLLAPDLAVEVASPNENTPGLNEKARRYLQFGTRLVWVVWPRHQTVDVWHAGDTTATTLTAKDTLDGEDVVPGFRYPIASLFA